MKFVKTEFENHYQNDQAQKKEPKFRLLLSRQVLSRFRESSQNLHGAGSKNRTDI